MLCRKDQSDVASTLPYSNDELVSADVHFIATPITRHFVQLVDFRWGVFVHGVPLRCKCAGTDPSRISLGMQIGMKWSWRSMRELWR